MPQSIGQILIFDKLLPPPPVYWETKGTEMQQMQFKFIFNKLYFCPIFPQICYIQKVIRIEHFLVSRPQHLNNNK